MSMNPSSVLLTDRVAVVTGGGAGIGRGIARGLASFGARVAIWERDADTAAVAAEEVGGLAITTDVRQSAEVDAALAHTLAALGPVSVISGARALTRMPCRANSNAADLVKLITPALAAA
jgi:3-oxoacyl-[acyl-carrier protein] reductase